MKNQYRILPLEEFVKQIPNTDHVLYVGQRQSGRSLTADVFNAIQRLDGDTRKVVHYDCIGQIDGPTATKLSLYQSDRNLIIRGERCVYTRAVDTIGSEIKRVFEAIPQTYARNKYDIPTIFVAPVNFPGTGTTMLVKMLNLGETYDSDWLLTAFSTSPLELFEDITITDANNKIQSIVDWLWCFNLTPVDGTLEPSVNPYRGSEEAFMTMLSKGRSLLPMYQFMMAKEMLEIHSGITLLERDGDDVCCYIYDQK